MKAINMCISRFDSETREAFLDLYTKIDESQLSEDGEIVENGGHVDVMEDILNQYNEKTEEVPF
jgi:hypothetical protein